MNPLLPGNDRQPTGQALNIKSAFKANSIRWRHAAQQIKRAVERLPFSRISVPDDEAPKVRKEDKRTAILTNMECKSSWFARNAEFEYAVMGLEQEVQIFQNAYLYQYEVDAGLMDRTMDIVGAILQQDLLDGSDFWTSRFWLTAHIADAFEDGTLESFDSAVRITDGTPVESSMAIFDARQMLATPAYQDRLRLVHGRVFEEMKGLTAEMKSQLRLVLTESIARGVGIADITGMINKRLAVGMVRAERIARTEINRAYRQAYMDEATELNNTALKDDEWMIMQMHRSALSPTTRKHHAQRHGRVFTAEQQRNWWAEDGNAINCLCSTLDVLVNKKTGQILQKKLQERMIKQREQWFPVGK